VALLRFAAEGVDRIHRQRALHGRERAHTGVATLELLHDEPVRDVVQPRATVFLRQVCAEDAQLRHLGDELLGEFALDVVLADDRQHTVVHEAAHAVPYRALVFAELAIDVEEIVHDGMVSEWRYSSRAAWRPMRPERGAPRSSRVSARRADGAMPTSRALARNVRP